MRLRAVDRAVTTSAIAPSFVAALDAVPVAEREHHVVGLAEFEDHMLARLHRQNDE